MLEEIIAAKDWDTLRETLVEATAKAAVGTSAVVRQRVGAINAQNDAVTEMVSTIRRLVPADSITDYVQLFARGMPGRRAWPRGVATAKAASAGTKRVSAGSAEPLLVTTPTASDESAPSAREPGQRPEPNCERFCAIMTTVCRPNGPTRSATLLRPG